MHRYNILIIDDDEDDFLIVKSLLEEIAKGPLQFDWASSYVDGEKLLAENRIRELESEVITVMKSKSGPWKKKELANILYEKNQNFEMSYQALMKNLSSIFTDNPNITTVKPWGWEFVQPKETIG